MSKFIVPESSTSWRGLPEPPKLEGVHFPQDPATVMRIFSEGPGTTDLEKISGVIIGQDPYPNVGYANGFCFAISPNAPDVPHSLQRIKNELFAQYDVSKDDEIKKQFSNGLEHWAKGGILLINVGLTVSPGVPGSHIPLWQKFTTEVIKRVGAPSKTPRVFILWGGSANQFSAHIDKMHCILTSAHPASRGGAFSGHRHFVLANEFLVQYGREPIMRLGENPRAIEAVKKKLPPTIREIIEKHDNAMRKITSEIKDLEIQKTELKELVVTSDQYISAAKEFDDKIEELTDAFEKLEDSVITVKSEKVAETVKLLGDSVTLLKEDMNTLNALMISIIAEARKK